MVAEPWANFGMPENPLVVRGGMQRRSPLPPSLPIPHVFELFLNICVSVRFCDTYVYTRNPLPYKSNLLLRLILLFASLIYLVIDQ